MGIILVFVFFVGGGWLLGKIIGNILFPKKDSEIFTSNSKEPNITINNYTTEQHLHITGNQLHKLSKKSNNQ